MIEVASSPTPGRGLALDELGQIPITVRSRLPGYVLSHVEGTSPVTITATTEATATTIVTADAYHFDGRVSILLDFYAPYAEPATGAGSALTFWLYDALGQAAAASIGRIWIAASASIDQGDSGVRAGARITPAAGLHTFSVRASQFGGNGVVYGGAGGVTTYRPLFIRLAVG